MQIPVRFSNYFVHYPACYAGLLSSYLAPLERLVRFLLRVIARSIFFVFQGDSIARFRPARFRPAVHSSGLLPPNFFHFYLRISFFCCNFAAQNQIEALNNIFREGELDKNSVHSILEYTFGDDLFLLLGGVSSIDPAFHAGFFLRISGR